MSVQFEINFESLFERLVDYACSILMKKYLLPFSLKATTETNFDLTMNDSTLSFYS